MTLKELGYNHELEKYRQEHNLGSLEVARVISEHKERYIVKNEKQEYEAEIIGNLRFSASSRCDFPAVGDWVAISTYDDQKALIYAVFPRKTLIERQAVGKYGEIQIIATNIDYALVIQAVDRDFNLNRLERYLTICHASKVVPIIILNKIDLIDEAQTFDLVAKVKSRVPRIKVLAISNVNMSGHEDILKILEKGKTYCLLGSSGVGKSTLVNISYSGSSAMRTKEISNSTQKGKHVTTHRELILLKKGGILIDNPGLREVGITNASGLEETFDLIANLSSHCKFSDCTHTHEEGCAILTGIEDGTIDQQSYENYLKMVREQARFNSSVVEKRKKDRETGKLYKRIMNIKKREKF